jgi:hypothetical protein
VFLREIVQNVEILSVTEVGKEIFTCLLLHQEWYFLLCLLGKRIAAKLYQCVTSFTFWPLT